MDEIKLTPRLRLIADLVPQGASLADVGTDHAWLPLYLLQRGRISRAIASDLREGPLARARQNAESCGLLPQLTLRLAAGLDAVAPSACDTVSIAGMGGETIAEILQAAPWAADGAHLLLLQPMTRAAVLRQFLWAHGYEIQREQLCREEHRIYTVLVVRGGAPVREVPLAQCDVSPALRQDALAREYIGALLAREQRALVGMQSGQEVAPCAAQQQRVQYLETVWEEWK